MCCSSSSVLASEKFLALLCFALDLFVCSLFIIDTSFEFH